MRISSTEDANNYYSKVNQLVDEYINDWGIKPSALKNYLKPGGKRFAQFLSRNGMNEVSGADRILKDVIEDRCAIESDGVLTFENFNFIKTDEYTVNLLSQEIFKGIENSQLSHEKCIADYFDVNLSNIEILDEKKHLFKIEDWGKVDLMVIIYDQEDIDLIKFNITNYITENLKGETKELIDGLTVKISEILDPSKLQELIDLRLSEDILTQILSKQFGEDWDFERKHGDFYIWVC